VTDTRYVLVYPVLTQRDVSLGHNYTHTDHSTLNGMIDRLRNILPVKIRTCLDVKCYTLNYKFFTFIIFYYQVTFSILFLLQHNSYDFLHKRLLLRRNVRVGNMNCFLTDLSTSQLAVVGTERNNNELN